MRILVVEDDELTARAIATVLAQQTYAVEIATDGQVAWELVESFDFDLILLDVMVPKLDGISLCKQLRSHDYQMPILLLTACDSSHDKAIGLDAGADDYVVKPFDPEELAARVRALLRRGGVSTQPVLKWGDLQLDPGSYEVRYGEKPFTLTPKEYAMLELFLRNSSRVFSCGTILEQVWAYDEMPGEEAVRTHIKGLRQKLKAVGAPTDLIETVYGIGYRLKPCKATTPPSSASAIETEKLEPGKLELGKQSQQQTLTAIAGVWERFKDRVSEQVSILEQAAAAGLNQSLHSDLRQQAEREAHTLAGSLGTFGFTEGSQLARKIEQLLQVTTPLSARQSKTVSQLVKTLRQAIEQSPGTTTTVTDAPLNAPPATGTSDAVLAEGDRSLTSLPIPAHGKVMIVDDDPQILATLQVLLDPWGLHVIPLDDPRQFWQTLESATPDLLILDIKMPHLSGLDLCQMIRNDASWSGLPIMMLTAYTDAETVNQVFAVGADDFVSKPIVGPELVTRIINRLERVRLLRQLAEIDPLTNVSNRRKATQDLHRLISLSKRQQHPLCLAVLGLDDLKQINDRYGHDTGDAVLRHVGQLLLRSFRGEDVVARWSNEEFLVGWYGISKSKANDRLTHLLEALRQQDFTAPDSTVFHASFNAGFAQLFDDGLDLQSLYQAANAALHQAQSSGLSGLADSDQKLELEGVGLQQTQASHPQTAQNLQLGEERLHLALESLQNAKSELEVRVAERTVELVGLNEQLQRELAERQRSQQILQEQAELLKQSAETVADLYNNAPCGYHSLDAAGHIVRINDTELRWLGYERSEVLNKPFSAFLTPESGQLFQEGFSQFKQLGWVNNLEFELVCKDGSILPVSLSATALYDGSGNYLMSRSTLFDIRQQQAVLQQRQQAEAALRASQARFAGILEIAEDAIISIDATQKITLFNQGAEKIFGYTAQEAIGQPLDWLLPFRFAAAHRQHVADFSTSPSTARKMGERREIFGRRKDGTDFPAEASISKLEINGEQVFTVILRDVSQRKQAEAALEHLSHQNELILNSVGEGLCGLDPQGRIAFVNPAAAKLLGYTIDELIGQPIWMIMSHTTADGAPSSLEASPIYSSLRNGVAHQIKQDIFWRKDASSFPVEYTSTPIQEQSEIVGSVITFRDITERQLVERMKDEFISIVSHELRTPLTSLHGSLGMLASGLLDTAPDTGKRLLEIAVDSTDRLVRLINDILDVERIESGRVQMEKQSCNAADLINHAVDVMQTMAEKFGITLVVSGDSIQLWADSDRIIQTLTNLLSNAIKFSLSGSTVSLSAVLIDVVPTVPGSHKVLHPISPPYALFSVRDQGRGIPEDKLEAIFERFQQVDASDSRNHDGTGLGLAICRSIVQQHEGEIWVESVLGEGSTFYFTLPVNQESYDH